MTEHAGDNHGISISGNASVSDSALAAGDGASAVHGGGGGAEEVRRQLAAFRAELARQAAGGTLEAEDQGNVEESAQAVEDELAADARPGRLRALTARLRELSTALVGAGALAQAAGQLEHAVHALTG